jgi:hypothetical protein
MDQDTGRSLQYRGFDVGVRCNEKRKWAGAAKLYEVGGASTACANFREWKALSTLSPAISLQSPST